jgi:DNA-binding response OmpR family regulator
MVTVGSREWLTTSRESRSQGAEHVAECRMAGPTSMRRVLVVEDDASIRELLRLHLDLAGFSIDESEDGQRTALDRARSTPFDLVLLDIMLPGLDGVSVCRAIRNGGPNAETPILMLTAREGESDKVLGLESGADDYLTKPFGVRELMARIGAPMRRHHRRPAEAVPSPVLDVGELSLDRERRTATVRGGRIELTKQEFDLLYLMASRPGAVFTRAACCKRSGATTPTSPIEPSIRSSAGCAARSSATLRIRRCCSPLGASATSSATPNRKRAEGMPRRGRDSHAGKLSSLVL